MKRLTCIILILLLTTFVNACGGSSLGGVEAGNPPDGTRNLTGTLGTTTSNNAIQMATTSCVADTVIATDSSGVSTTSLVSSNCGFTHNLAINRAYLISLVKNDVFVATFLFSKSSLSSTRIIYVSSGSGAIGLGNVTVAGGVARVEFEPYQFLDRDGDGIPDYDDDDDDDDGVPDDEEEDCDLDGYADDDDDDFDCDVDGDSGQILEVYPPNDTNLDDQIGLVEENAEIFFRANCEIDESTIDETSFRVVPNSGSALNCDYSFSNSGSKVECDHEDNEMQASMIYTVTVTDVSCEGGQPLTNASWTFKTKAAD